MLGKYTLIKLTYITMNKSWIEKVERENTVKKYWKWIEKVEW